MSTTATQVPNRADRAVLIALFFTLFVGVADNQVIGPFLPTLAKSFHYQPGELGPLSNAVPLYSIFAACAALIAGTAINLSGRRRFLRIAMAAFIIAMFATSFVTSAFTFTLLRALTGMAAGIISSCTISYAADYFPYHGRGRAMGIIMASYFGAATIGVVGLSFAADRLGWPNSYRILMVLAGFALVLLFALLPNDTENVKLRLRAFAGVGTILSKRASLTVFGLAFLVSGGLVTFLTYIGTFLNQEFHRTTSQIATIFLIGGFAAVIAAPLAGILADRIGKRPVIIVGNLLLASSFALITYLEWGAIMIGVFGLASMAAALRQGPFEALTTAVIDSERRGVFVALRNTCSQLGIATSALVGGAIYNHGAGFRPVALLCAGLTLAACAPVLLLQEPKSDAAQAVRR